MSHLPFTLFAYFFNSCSVLIDKFLLEKHIPNPLLYVFNISLFSLLVLVLIPFVHFPVLSAFFLASISTVLWTCGAFFMYKALKIGFAARVIPVIGTLIPVTLTFVSAYSGGISANELWAVVILMLGFVCLVLPYFRGKLIKEELLLEVTSALLFANSYIILRWAYLQDNFFNVFVYSRLILVPVVLAVFLIPGLKKIVWSSNHQTDAKPFKFKSKMGLLFFVGQFFGGASELLLTFSISLANPALVNSLQGTQYVFLFLFSLILARKFPHIYREAHTKLSTLGKVVGIILIGLGLYALAYGEMMPVKQNLGITFSPRYAKSLGLEPVAAFQKIIDELAIKKVRLPVYWDEVEKDQGKYDFSQIDSYLEVAQAKKIEVVLVLGYKQPRWPECFHPNWVQDLSIEDKDQAILKLVNEEVAHFKSFDAIKFWQVENEPFFNFGVCEKVDDRVKARVKKEVALVRSQDSRKIIITDSGELSLWGEAIKNADILGVTLYRTVWNPFFGLTDYPLPPLFYRLKSDIMKLVVGRSEQPTFISELQGEPWIPAQKSIEEVSLDDKTKYFPPDKLRQNVEFAKLTGFSDIYLWGAEWWYWMSLNGHPEYMDMAKGIFESF